MNSGVLKKDSFESFDGALPERSLMRVSRGNLLALSALSLAFGFGCLLLLSPISFPI